MTKELPIDSSALKKSIDYVSKMCVEAIFQNRVAHVRTTDLDLLIAGAERYKKTEAELDLVFNSLKKTENDLEHSMVFARNLSRDLDEMKQELAKARIEVAKLTKEKRGWVNFSS